MDRNLLFVCVRNRVRSPFAEFLFKKMLQDQTNDLYDHIKVSSAGFYPTKLDELLSKMDIMRPEPFYNTSMSEIAREELMKRGIEIPSSWKSRELRDDDVKNSGLIIVALSEQQEELRVRFPDVQNKIYTTRQIVGRDKPFTHEDFSHLPFDNTFWDYCEEDPIYVNKIILEMEEVLITAFPWILKQLGVKTV